MVEARKLRSRPRAGSPSTVRPAATALTRGAATLVCAAAGLAGFVPRVAAEDRAPGAPQGAPAADAPVPVTEFFRGRVTRLTKQGEISIHYDFEDAAQLADFEKSLPFRAIPTVQATHDGGRLRVKGTGSFRHRGVFDGLVGGDAAFTARQPRDFGYAVTEERESEVFTLYCVQDRYFGLGDGVHHPQNMIIKFIPRDPNVNKDGYQDWRYCGSRGQKPEIRRNDTLRVRIEREGIESRMWMLDWKSKGREAGRDLSSQMIAIYTYDSDVEVDDLTISGRLSPAFVERHRIDMSVEIGEPDPEDAPGEPEPAAIDPAETERVRGILADYPLKTAAPALVKLLCDPSVPLPLREEAVQRAKEVGAKNVVPFAVQGLYSEDEDTRRLSIHLIEGLVGKDFGYRADAPEEKRGKAVAALNAHLLKRAHEFR